MSPSAGLARKCSAGNDGAEPHANDQALHRAPTLATANMGECGDYRDGGQGPRIPLLIMQEEAYVPERGIFARSGEKWKV